MTKEQVIKMYENYISNLEWHIKTNKPNEVETNRLKQRIGDYKEVLSDLQNMEAAPSQPDGKNVEEAAEIYAKENLTTFECGGYYGTSEDWAMPAFIAGANWQSAQQKPTT